MSKPHQPQSTTNRPAQIDPVLAREEAESDEPPILEQSGVFDILSNDRRLLVVQFLSEYADEDHTLGSVVDYVTAVEHNKEIAAVKPDERHRVYTSIRQFHIPILEDECIITLDETTDIIHPGSRFGEVEEFLDSCPNNETDTSSPERLVSAIFALGIASFGLSLVAMADAGSPSPVSYGSVSFAGLAVVTALSGYAVIDSS